MTPEQWSWLAAAVTAAGVWIGGLNPRAGWIYGIGAQAVWVSYGLSTGQSGMVGLSVVMWIIFVRNLIRWRGTKFARTPRARERQGDEDATERA